MIKHREVITFKEEVTYNTDPTPAGTDAVLVQNLSWANEGLRMTERNPTKPTFGPEQSVYGGHLRSVTFDVEIKGSGTAGAAPEMGALLRSCGFDETIVGGISVTYDPLSTGIVSGTMYYYADGLLRKLTGCRGTVSFNIETGAPGMASFTMTGHDGGTTDVTLVTPTYDAAVPVASVSVPFAFNSYSAVINALSFDMGNQMAMPADISASDGFGEIQIVNRNVTGSFDPEAVLKAAEDFEAFVSGSATAALDTGTIGATAGNIYQVQHPACKATDIAPGDREGITTYDMSYQAIESTGDDAVSIAFT